MKFIYLEEFDVYAQINRSKTIIYIYHDKHNWNKADKYTRNNSCFGEYFAEIKFQLNELKNKKKEIESWESKIR